MMGNDRQKILDNVWIRAIMLALSIAFFFLVCHFLRGILISFFLAFTVAYILDPVVDLLEARKYVFQQIRIRRTLAICILLISVILVVGGLLTYAVPKTVNGVQQVGNTLKESFPGYRSKIKQLIEQYGNNEIATFLKNKLGIIETGDKSPPDKEDNAGLIPKNIKRADIEQLNRGVKDIDSNIKKTDDILQKGQILEPLADIKKYLPQASKFVFSIAKKAFKSTFGLFGIIINFFIFGVVTIYLLKDFDKITARIHDLIPISKREKVANIFLKIDDNLKSFFRGQITVCLILSLIYSIGLTIVGVPLSFVLGFIAGFGNIIPYVGTIIGLGFTLAITFFHFHDIQHLVFAGIVFGLGQFLEGALITPKIVGTRLGLNPVIIIVSILIWSQLLGFLGLLLAVPITSAAKVLIDEGVIRYRNSNIYKRLPK